MIESKGQMRIGQQVVISHFAFRPPLVVTAELEQEGCFIFPIRTSGTIYRPASRQAVDVQQGILMRCGQYVNKWQGIQREQAEVVVIRLFPKLIEEMLQGELGQRLCGGGLPSKHSTAIVQLDLLLQRFLDSLLFYFQHPKLVNDELVTLKIKELIMLLLNTNQPNPVSDLLASLFHPAKHDLRQIVETRDIHRSH